MLHQPLPYRRDIDGLRAIAVLAVVLYHFGTPGLPGGFVGVDIFFVISGFLIGGLLWREQEATGRISLAAFYTRRIRRLAPAFAVMTLLTLAIGWVLLLPFEYRALGKQVIAATVYLSNVLFWREAGYFDAASSEKPLLHTWSLSVEEQFYILLPLLLIAVGRIAPKARLAMLWGVALVSFVACVLRTPVDANSTFYLFHFRAWELLAGVLLAVHLAQGWSPKGHLLLSAVGLALIAIAITQFDAADRFPGWRAAVPVAGALFLLAGGLRPHVLTRILSLRGPVFIGLISYSLYLWHWPVHVFASYAETLFNRVPSTVWIVISIAIAALSWRFVEQPFRREAVRPNALVAGAATLSVLLLVLGGVLFKTNGVTSRFAGTAAEPHIVASGDFLQDFSRCKTPDTGPLAGLEVCPVGPDGAPGVLVWGDSHLRAVFAGLDAAAHRANSPALVLWRAGCPPLFGVQKRENYATSEQDAACGRANAQIEEAIALLGISDVLLVGRWSYYATGQGIGLDAGNTIELTTDFHASVAQTATRFADMEVGVHVLRQVPEIPSYDSRKMARALAYGASDVSSWQRVERSEAFERRATLGEAAWAKAGAQIHDPWPLFCDERICSALPGGQPFYFDNNHLTNAGARALVDVLLPVFAHD